MPDILSPDRDGKCAACTGDVRNLVERLRQIAESQRMDFDSPNVAATLDDAATTLEALASIGSVVAEEPEWEYTRQAEAHLTKHIRVMHPQEGK